LRIELGEIEARLAELPAVREVVVLAREAGRTEPGRGEGTGSTSGTGVTGDRRLVAYWVARDGLPETDVPTVEELRDHLKAELPAYMVPSAFVKLEAMPLTPNGKVDRRALPAPDAEALVTHAYEAPQGPVEEVLAGIWQDLLGVERVGRHDSFFDLGGHSLLLLRLQHRIKGRIKYVRIADILENKTIYQQARIIESKPIVFTHPEKNLVTLKKGSGEISIFLVHEISGDILSYIEFSRSFSEKVTVFGVRAQEFDGHDLFSMSLPDIARCHAKEIKAVQPCGPYRLAGWSSGGLFAYEIANQLMKSGEDVGFVGAIDTHLYSSSDWNDITDLDILVHFIHSHNISIPEFVLQKIKHDTNICDMISVFSDHDLMPSGFDIHEIKHRVMTYRALYDACRSYEIRRLFMRVCLFTVQDYNGCGAVYGWKRCAGERPDIVYIKGDHENVMLLPNVSDLALEVEKKL